MSRRGRGKQAIRRRHPSRDENDVILIMCEAERTEIEYFRTIRETKLKSGVRISVRWTGTRGDPRRAVKRSVAEIEERAHSSTLSPFDDAWLILDVESPQNPNIVEAVKSAKECRTLRVVLSNPCFEYWYILHYECTASPFQTSDAARKKLKEHFPNYSKTNSAIAIDALPRTKTAMANSITLSASVTGYCSPLSCNPSTNLHAVIDRIIDLG